MLIQLLHEQFLFNDLANSNINFFAILRQFGVPPHIQRILLLVNDCSTTKHQQIEQQNKYDVDKEIEQQNKYDVEKENAYLIHMNLKVLHFPLHVAMSVVNMDQDDRWK
jgi:hypothetical protein